MILRQAMIMTAGLGTRLKPFTDLLPKPLFPILGVPVLQFALDRLKRAGINRVVMNVHHLPEVFMVGLARLDLNGIEVILSDERDVLLGSGGGLKKAAQHFEDGPILYVNGDVLFDFKLEHLMAEHRSDVTWWVKPKSPPREIYREAVIEDGYVTHLGDKKESVPFFASVAVIEKHCLENLPSGQPVDLTEAVFAPAVQRRALRAIVMEGRWHDLGSAELWAETNQRILSEMETGHLPQAWRQRIEEVSQRVAEKVWCANANAGVLRGKELNGPAYFQGQEFHGKSLGPHEYIFRATEGAGPGSITLEKLHQPIRSTT